MINYTMRGTTMTLDVATSRACGYLADIDGVTPDGSSSYEARQEVIRDAEIHSSSHGKPISVYATYPGCQDWKVDEIEVRTMAR